MPLHVSPAEFARLAKAKIAQPAPGPAVPRTAPCSASRPTVCAVCGAILLAGVERVHVVSVGPVCPGCVDGKAEKVIAGWPRDRVCQLCGKPLRATQSFSFNAQANNFAHLECRYPDTSKGVT